MARFNKKQKNYEKYIFGTDKNPAEEPFNIEFGKDPANKNEYK